MYTRRHLRGKVTPLLYLVKCTSDSEFSVLCYKQIRSKRYLAGYKTVYYIEPQNSRHIGITSIVPCREVVLISEVKSQRSSLRKEGPIGAF